MGELCLICRFEKCQGQINDSKFTQSNHYNTTCTSHWRRPFFFQAIGLFLKPRAVLSEYFLVNNSSSSVPMVCFVGVFVPWWRDLREFHSWWLSFYLPPSILAATQSILLAGSTFNMVINALAIWEKGAPFREKYLSTEKGFPKRKRVGFYKGF